MDQEVSVTSEEFQNELASQLGRERVGRVIAEMMVLKLKSRVAELEAKIAEINPE